MTRTGLAGVIVLAGVLAGSAAGLAQGRQGGGAPATARAAAQFDMTGYWVSIVSEDWRWRMMTPPKGDFESVPLNPEGRRVAEMWDLAKDKAEGNECRAFGAAAIMRVPGRLNITWQDDQTLKIETSAGTQTRLLRFAAPGAPLAGPAEPSWQGVSVADWQKQPASTLGSTARPDAAPAPARGTGGNLRVVTTRLRPGYLRANGVPYSDGTTITEYFYRHTGPRDLEWLTVVTVVTDPQFLNTPFITSSDFRKEPDGSKFSPTPCAIDPPRVARAPALSGG